MRRFLYMLAAFLILTPALSAAADEEAIQFFGHGWCDSSGKDGKGGVSIVVSGGKNNLIVRPGDGPGEVDDDTVENHPQWIVYRDADVSLTFEWTWVTTEKDKFFAKCWAGGGIAFNNSWTTIDITGAKYLVFDAKANLEGLDLNMVLCGDNDTTTGGVKLSEYAEGRKLGPKWTKVIIPLTSIPDLTRVDPAKLRMLRLDLITGTYPENKHCVVSLDNIYFTAADLVTPVENLGYLQDPNGVTVTWDKAPGEKIEAFVLTVDGRKVGKVGTEKRHAKLTGAMLKGNGPFVVGVAAANAKQSSAVQAVTVTLGKSQVQTAQVTLSDQLGRAISPYIYGFNGWGYSSKTIKRLGCTVSRMGGNASTNYNWKEDADNRGADWYFLNTANKPKGPENEKTYYKFTEEAFKGGADMMITIPTIGWVAKAPPEGGRLSTYPLSLFPDQEANDGGAGNGRTKDGKLIWGNDPSLNYVKSDPEYQKGWVETLVKSFGSASKGGVKFYSMDNEPGLWHWNHRDVCPQGIGYDDLADLNAQYAAMVKKVDPDAQVLGFVAWGVMELAGSPWDYIAGGKENIKIKDDKDLKGDKWTDRKAHGDVPQAIYFLKEMKKRSDKAGVRLIDYLDNHGFPEVWDTNAKGEKINVLGDFPYDPVLTPKQFDALRILWDDTFVSKDSWCYSQDNAPHLWTPWVGLIPKLKKYIDENFPGTKLAMTEYYPASSHHYHGGLLVAVTLGIFMREGMDMACDWGSTWEGNYVYLGHKLFGNYDDKGSRVGGKYVDSKSSSDDLYSFAARDGAKTFVALINKNHDSGFDTTVTLPAAATTVNTYILSETLGKRIFESGAKPVSGNAIKLSVPAFSAVLVVAQ